MAIPIICCCPALWRVGMLPGQRGTGCGVAFAGGARGPSRLGYCGATIIKLPLLLYDGLLWAVLVTSVVWCQASVRGVTPGRGLPRWAPRWSSARICQALRLPFQMGQQRLAARIVSPRRAAARQLLTVRTVAENSTVEQCKLAVEPFWGLQGQGTRYHERNIED